MSESLRVPTDDEVLAKCRASAAVVAGEATALVIDSETGRESAVALLGRMARLTKDVEARRVELVRPYNEHVKRVNDLVRALVTPVAHADRELRRKVLTFTLEQQKRAAEAQAEAERLRLESEARLRSAETAEAEGSTAVASELLDRAVQSDVGAQRAQADAVETARTVRTESGTGSIKLVWTFKVLNLERVPSTYLILDEAKVREAIRMGVREIPGLEILQTETLAIRR